VNNINEGEIRSSETCLAQFVLSSLSKDRGLVRGVSRLFPVGEEHLQETRAHPPFLANLYNFFILL
jgi:hypothetical protein